MNVDKIIGTMNEAGVAFLLIGGMNFLLRHEPVLTFDIDLWIDDTDDNRRKCEAALAALDAEWGESDTTWQRTSQFPAGWLSRQGMFSLHTPHGAIDIFRQVRGLPSWSESRKNAIEERTSSGVSYYGICDYDMFNVSWRSKRGRERPLASQPWSGKSRMPNQTDLTDLLQSEAAKRDRNWNPQERWRVIQQTIAWAEMQSTVRRNTKAACLANQASVLAGLAEYQASLGDRLPENAN